MDLALPPLNGQITSGFVSAHSSQTCKTPDKVLIRCNGNNIGIGYRTADGWAFGVYRNSINRTSAFLAYEEPLIAPKPFGVHVGLGLATGYRAAVQPFIYPAAVLRLGRVDLVVGAMPKMANTTPAVVWAQVRYSLAD